MVFLSFILLSLLYFSYVNAVILTRCQLVFELKEYGIPNDKLKDWICLIEAETGRDTDWFSGPNIDGSNDYGLFRINDIAWCAVNAPGGMCNTTCESVSGTDLTAAVKCAKTIYARHGFLAWYGWRENCREASSLPDTDVCFQ